MQVFVDALRRQSFPSAKRSTLPAVAVALTLCLAAPVPTQAQGPLLDIIVNPITQIPQGTTGFVPVFIRNIGATPVSVAATSFQFQISPPLTGSGQLTFFTLPNAASDPTFANSSYIFSGNSLDQFFNQPVGQATSPTVFTGSDAANAGETNINPGQQFLLADLPVSAFGTVAGSSFLVSQTTNPNFNGFVTETGAAIPFISTPGTVLITGAPSVIPEPSTLVVSLLSGLFGLPALARRWKRGGAAA